MHFTLTVLSVAVNQTRRHCTVLNIAVCLIVVVETVDNGVCLTERERERESVITHWGHKPSDSKCSVLIISVTYPACHVFFDMLIMLFHEKLWFRFCHLYILSQFSVSNTYRLSLVILMVLSVINYNSLFMF
jgi:hypothetical protein